MSFPIRAVVLDWAGTMIDHGSRAPVIALRRVFTELGVPISEAEARVGMGRAKRDHVRGIVELPRVFEAWRSAKGSVPTEKDVTCIHDALEPVMVSATAVCSTLIPGAAELVARLRANGVKIGSTTGYTRPMMAQILPLAAKQGYAPDLVVCAGETIEGRPSPLMMWKALVELGAWPAWACVKVDDAAVGISEGKSAGSWTVGIAASGNGVGLDRDALLALPASEREGWVAAAAATLSDAGADYVIDSIADLWPVLQAIRARIEAGEKPRG